MDIINYLPAHLKAFWWKDMWGELGNDLTGSGHVHLERVWRGWYLLDRWLEQFHPHGRVFEFSKDYGNPICFAYCYGWSNFYWRQVKQIHTYNVGFENLSQEYKDWYKTRNEE